MDRSDPDTLFDAVLYPHRSLSPRGVRFLIAGICGVLGLVALFFTAMGAWPVLPFFGGEVLLIWWAFRTNARDGRMFERLHLTPEAMTVARVRPSGRETQHRFAPPHWLSVNLIPRPGGDNELRLASHGRSLMVGSFLTPDERGELADALRGALRRLRGASETRA
jgi:uncharacterized membrane protein